MEIWKRTRLLHTQCGRRNKRLLYVSFQLIQNTKSDDTEESHATGQSSSRNHQLLDENGTSNQKQASAAVPHSLLSSSRRNLNAFASRRALVQNGPSGDADFEIKRATGHSQIYSGFASSHSRRKPHSQREIPRLETLCLQILKENINCIDDLGGPGVAYHIIKPVLEACDVQQLSRIEEANPHLYVDGDTDELWKRHVRRDFPKADVPDDFVYKRRRKHRQRTDSFSSDNGDDDDRDADSEDDDAEPHTAWRDVYAHHTVERERNFQRITARIQQNKRDRDDPVKRTMTAEIIGGGVRAPREVRKTQQLNAANTAEPELFRGGASALARKIVANSCSGGESISVTNTGTNAASDSVVKISGTGGPRAKDQKAAKRAFAPLMAKSLKMLKR